MSPSPNSPVPTLTTEPSIYSPQPVYHPNVRSPSLHSRALSDFESASKTSSLLGPPLTRDPSSAASNSTTGYLPTPTDDVMHVPPPLSRAETTITSYYRNQAFPERLGQHGLTRKNRVGQGPGDLRVRQRPASVQVSSSGRMELGILSASSEHAPSSIEPRNIAPDSTLVLPPRIERQRAARDLISRYEDLESAAQAPLATPSGSQRSSGQRSRSVSSVSPMARRDLSLPPIPPTCTHPAQNQGANANPPQAPHSHCLPESPSYFSSFARKGGKLRNSFTSLVQLLGDKTKARDSAKKRNSVSPSVSPSRAFNALPKGFKLRLSKRASAGSSPASSPGKVNDGENSSKILPDMNELLKTEASAPHGFIPDQKTPLWMAYTVSLYPNTIILEVPNPGLSSSSKFQIPLSELYDAHSIAAKDLPAGSIPLPGSIALPPGFGNDIYVFEAQCYGGRIERFAAPNMSIRMTWVRHLLDILIDKDPGSKDEGHTLDTVASTPAHPRTEIRRLPLVSNTALMPTSLARDTTVSKPIESTLQSEPPTRKHSEPSLMRLSTPTRPRGGILDSRPSSVCGTRQAISVLPNPWESPATLSRRPTSVMAERTASHLMSPRSDRSRMTASPSICRLDERNLVRNRLAMFEGQASPSPNGRESIRSRGAKEGSVNWEALSEIRSGRGGSRLSRTTSDGIGSPFTGPQQVRNVPSPVRTHSNNGMLFKPMWPFPDPMTSDSTTLPGSIGAKLGGRTPKPAMELTESRSATRIDTVSGLGRKDAGTPLSFVSLDQTTKPESKPIQVLGNLPPSKNTESIMHGSPSRPTVPATTQDLSLQPILDRLNTLTSALRESDVAHSTKASGLGQLIASTQDHIVQAVDNGAKIATGEYHALVGHLEGLEGKIGSLADRPLLGTEEWADLSTIKETVERIAIKLEDFPKTEDQDDRGEIKTVIIDQTDGLKQAVRDLSLKLDHVFSKDDILAKLEGLTEAATWASAPPNGDLDTMADLVQQMKSHISSLPDPHIVDTPTTVEKLDSIFNSMANLTTPIDISSIQATLADIQELCQARQTTDAIPISATQVDLSDVLMKLDGITAICQSIMVARSEASLETGSGSSHEAQQIEDAEHRTVQVQQTAELVRYSNELNTWLEKFVANASTQMDSVGAGLGALRRDLGLHPPPPADGQETDTSPQGVIQEFRTMFEEQIKSAADAAASLNALLVAFNDEQARNAEARENLAADSVLKMIEIQRQEQERLLKQLASDLSSDIRGERIRFVEAMSQATSMNVQLHVEEFKKQLTHEVLALTDEVGRLREERKTIQHQIAQLFLVKSEHEAECRRSDAVASTKATTQHSSKW
ncbi:putative protein KIAA1522 [Homo sapiens] [Rhizoctonia solani]|uniref:PH domain-containing protein n=1 Tax=Rhizoctonia solani TaxID=456999 RepID=A0A0K6GAC4_9AGAM|nr:putative protein KIAA1522 [Homo sapiens] [Rhizoctonia solani]